MRNLIESFLGYEFGNQEFFMSFVLFILTIIMGVLVLITGWVFLTIPIAGALILSIMFLNSGVYK